MSKSGRGVGDERGQMRSGTGRASRTERRQAPGGHDAESTVATETKAPRAEQDASAPGDPSQRGATDGTFASRIELVLRRLFVGRERELQAFLASLDESSETGVLLVTGELGVGKSALLNRFARIAAEQGSGCIRVDGRAEGARAALEDAAALLRELGSPPHRPILFVDNFHHLASEERWFVHSYLPALPTPALVVVADRRDKARSYLEPNAFSAPFCRRIQLRPLTSAEATEYLNRRGIAESHRKNILSFAQGIPLLLVIAAELGLDAEVSTEQLERAAFMQVAHEFIEVADTNERRTALATLAIARTVVLELLANVLDPSADADGCFKWLATLSFVEQTPLGLRAHRVARMACIGLLRQNHPRPFWSVIARLRAFYDWQLRQPGGPHDRWVSEWIFLEKHRSTFRHEVRFDDDAHVVEDACPEDHDAIVALAERQDGTAAASWVRRWLAGGIGSCEVLRAPDGSVGGYVLWCAVSRPWPKEIEADPAAGVVDAYLDEQGWTPSSESTALFLRSSAVEQAPGESGPVTSALLASHMVARLLGLSKLQFHVGITRSPEVWLDVGSSIAFEHGIAGSYHDGRFEHSAVVCDWRSPERRVTKVDPELRARLEAVADRTWSMAPARPASVGVAESNAFGALLKAQLAQLAAAAGLTSRENEVLDLLVLGRNATEIGKVLGISARTAKFHQARLLSKLGADSRIDLIRLLL